MAHWDAAIWGGMSDVFISYARADKALAEPIIARLRRLGLDVFVDVFDVETGAPFPQRLADAVRNSKSVVGCWTKRSLASTWCRLECSLALEIDTLVPIMLEPFIRENLGEFIHVNFSDLTDLGDQDKHLGWHQTLQSIAAKLRRWVAINPSQPDASRTAQRAERVQASADEARPAISHRRPEAVTPALLWEELQDSRDVEKLRTFADHFQGTVYGYRADERRKSLEDQERKFALLDWDDVGTLELYIAEFPVHPKSAVIQTRVDQLRAAYAERADLERLERERAARDRELRHQLEKQELDGRQELETRKLQAVERERDLRLEQARHERERKQAQDEREAASKRREAQTRWELTQALQLLARKLGIVAIVTGVVVLGLMYLPAGRSAEQARGPTAAHEESLAQVEAAPTPAGPTTPSPYPFAIPQRSEAKATDASAVVGSQASPPGATPSRQTGAGPLFYWLTGGLFFAVFAMLAIAFFSGGRR